METSINLDLDDLMEPEDGVDELPALSTLPALDGDDDGWDTGMQRNEGGLLDSVLDPGGGEEGEDTKARRIINRKPVPKLDDVRLTSERGLPALLKHFENVKFRGKGHETADLDKLMRSMEHWAHRLFPKMPFDDVIQRIEKLGSKKSVQTCLTKIRLDMPLLDEDFVTRLGDGEGDEEDAPKEITGQLDDVSPQRFGNSLQSPNSVGTPKIGLTDEQRERIECNKKLAMERRLTKEQKDAACSQPPQKSNGLSQDEIDGLVVMETKEKRMDDGDGIDSGEADLENEIWSQMTGTAQKGTKEKSQKDADQTGTQTAAVRKRRVIEDDDDDVESDEVEMENKMWSQMSKANQVEEDSNSRMEDGQSQAMKKVIDDSDDVEIEKELSSQGVGASQAEKAEKEDEPSHGKRRRIIEEEDDDDEFYNNGLENKSSSQITSTNQIEQETDLRNSESAMELDDDIKMSMSKKRHVIDDDDDDDIDDVEQPDETEENTHTSQKKDTEEVNKFKTVQDDDDD